MAAKVWIDSWQMQCCGARFAVGDVVTWTAVQAFDRDFLSIVIGQHAANELSGYEDHHDVERGPLSEIRGTVRSIEAVSCRYEKGDRALVPTTGTAVIERRERADGWEPEDRTSERPLVFVGYRVTLD